MDIRMCFVHATKQEPIKTLQYTNVFHIAAENRFLKYVVTQLNV